MFKTRKSRKELKNPCFSAWYFSAAASRVENGDIAENIEELISFVYLRYREYICLHMKDGFSINEDDAYDIEKYTTEVFGTDFGLSKIRGKKFQLIFQYSVIVALILKDFNYLRNNPNTFILLSMIDACFPIFEASSDTIKKYEKSIKKLDWINEI